MARNGARSPSFAVAASASGTKVKCSVACLFGSLVKVVRRADDDGGNEFHHVVLLLTLLLSCRQR